MLHQSGSTTLDGAAYAVDNAGNRTSKTDELASVTSNYTYDPIYELTQVTQSASTTESYSYDAVGNRTASLGVSSYTNNSSNELTATSSTSYTYDYNGNTLTKVVGSNTTSYAWDFENRMSSVTLPGSGGTVTFKYDPFGRRIYKSSSSATSVYAYDGDNLIEETNSSGTVVARYAQTQNIDEPLAMLRSSTTSYFHADALGSITSLSNASGSQVQTYQYDSFGKQTASTGSLTNPFQYTARELDPETSLYYYRARYYDPSTGRFLREDPALFRGGTNFYAFLGNSPLYFVDPWGLCKVEMRFASLGAIGAYDHAYLVVQDPHLPFPIYVRGGPEHGHSSGDASGGSTAGSSGSLGGISGLGWGPVIGQMGVYAPHTPDWDPGEPISEVLLDDANSCACVVGKMAGFTNAVNGAGITYNPFSTNSNAFAYGAARAAGLNPGTPPVPVPGHDTNLPIPK